jgi:hypothetical protein
MTIKNINKPLSKQQGADKKHTSLFESAGLTSIETALNKIPLIGKALPFVIINLLVATIFYYLCYSPLWFFSSVPEEEGQWFVRRVDILGKSYTRLTTYAAEQIAYFVAGIAACLFTYANYSDNDKKHFLLKTAFVSLIPLGLLFIAKIITSTFVYIPLGFIYGQFVAIVIACFVKLFGGDKTAKNA